MARSPPPPSWLARTLVDWRYGRGTKLILGSETQILICAVTIFAAQTCSCRAGVGTACLNILLVWIHLLRRGRRRMQHPGLLEPDSSEATADKKSLERLALLIRALDQQSSLDLRVLNRVLSPEVPNPLRY